MTQKTIEKILKQVECGKLSSKRAFEKLKSLPYETFSDARLDHHRTLRKGFPEAIYAPGKSLRQLEKLIGSIQKSGQTLIVTRLEEETYQALRRNFRNLYYSEEARIAYFKKAGVNGVSSSSLSAGSGSASGGRAKRSNLAGSGETPQSQRNGIASSRQSIGGTRNDEKSIAILSAGTSDLPVAEEAAVTLELIGRRVIRIYDCGVAGLHRLLDQLPQLKKVKAIICIAGMEGALPSVVAGLVDKPVIAVPTRVGYGASFKGIAPLLAMLNSCSPGVAVVNIDNGFGAACFAATLSR